MKNNFFTTGPKEEGKLFKPPDMLMNAVFKVKRFGMPVTVEIQIHHDDILFLKETESHILYEIIRAPNPTALLNAFGSSTSANNSVASKQGAIKRPARPTAARGNEEAELRKKIAELEAEVAFAKRKKVLLSRDSETGQAAFKLLRSTGSRTLTRTTVTRVPPSSPKGLLPQIK